MDLTNPPEEHQADDARADSPETESQAQQSDDLDALLAEFDDQGGKTETPDTQQKQTDSRRSQIETDLRAWRQDQAKREVEDGLKTVAEILKSDANLGHVKDRVLRAMFYERAGEDHKVLTAFQNRKSNPAAFRKVVAKLGSEWADDLSIDVKATEDREAVAAAVRRTSTKEPKDDPDDRARRAATGSTAEFRKYLDSLGIH